MRFPFSCIKDDEGWLTLTCMVCMQCSEGVEYEFEFWNSIENCTVYCKVHFWDGWAGGIRIVLRSKVGILSGRWIRDRPRPSNLVTCSKFRHSVPGHGSPRSLHWSLELFVRWNVCVMVRYWWILILNLLLPGWRLYTSHCISQTLI